MKLTFFVAKLIWCAIAVHRVLESRPQLDQSLPAPPLGPPFAWLFPNLSQAADADEWDGLHFPSGVRKLRKFAFNADDHHHRPYRMVTRAEKDSTFLELAMAMDMITPDLMDQLGQVGHVTEGHRHIATEAKAVLFVNYHKTGSFLVNDLRDFFVGLRTKRNILCRFHGVRNYLSFCRVIQNKLLFEQPVVGMPTFRNYWTGALDNYVRGDFVASLDSPSSSWPFPQGVRVVSWVRDPVSMLLSAYRYHSNAISAEAWEGQKCVCHMCGEAERSMIFDQCHGTCGYYDLLNSLDEKTGVVVEAMHSRKTISVMLENFARWSEHPNVLHISIEHTLGDYSGTMECMLRFLGFKENPYVMEALQGFDIENRNNQNRQRHDTHDKYNNTQIRHVLESNKHWRRQLLMARAALEKVFVRQHKLFDCPMPTIS